MTVTTSPSPPRRTARRRAATHPRARRPNRKHHARRALLPALTPPRLLALFAAALVILYEFLVLRGPLAAAAAIPHVAVHPAHHDASHASSVPVPVSAADATTTAERVRQAAAAAAASQQPRPDHLAKPHTPDEPYRPPLAHAHAPPPASRTSTQPPAISERPPAPAHRLAIGLESEPADKDDAADKLGNTDHQRPPAPRVAEERHRLAAAAAAAVSAQRERATSSTGKDSGRENRRRHRRARTRQAKNSASSHDIEPPRPPRHARAGEKGAEPGAGENFWQWFQENKGSEKGEVSSSLSCPEESKRLCQMVYKYLRKYKIRAVFDASCGKNLDWIPGVVQKISNELWGFKYYCGEPDKEKMPMAKEKIGDKNFVEYVDDEWWKTGFPEDTELLFAWDTLPHIAYGRIWNFFVKARAQQIKYILVDNYPGILNDPSPKRNYLNLRKHPFRFPSAKEVVQNVTEPGETAKRQLLFYESSSLPDNLQ